MPDFDVEDKNALKKESFPYEIKIISGEKNNLFSMLKKIGGINAVLEEN